MKKQILRLTWYAAIIISLIGSTLNPAIADLNVGEPRTVRMIYFLPNDRPYRADVVQKMKDEILKVQTFYAEQMQAHGYGEVTFYVETDPQDERMVHRVDGQNPDSHYLDNTIDSVSNELSGRFNFDANIHLIVIDNSTDLVASPGECRAGGFGWRQSKNAGGVLVPDEFRWDLLAHELGHAFGLLHDFRNATYVMSYGQVRNQLSACSAEFLVVHPYFNPNVPIEEESSPAIELISPSTYPAGSKSVSVQLKVSDSDELHQVLLFGPNAYGVDSLVACGGLGREKNTLIEFDYDGVFTEIGFRSLSSDTAGPIYINAVDRAGNMNRTSFILAENSPGRIATLVKHTEVVRSVSFSPDGVLLATAAWDETALWDIETQTNIAVLQGGSSTLFSPNGTTLASGTWREVNLSDVMTGANIATLEHETSVTSVSFSPDGRTLASGLSNGMVELWDTSEWTQLRLEAVNEVNIPAPNLRAAIATALGKPSSAPIVRGNVATLTILQATEASISDLTGIESAIKLSWLDLDDNNITDISALAGLTNLSWLRLDDNNITDISALAGLTHLTELNLGNNSVSDISVVSNLTNLTELNLLHNNITDISALAGLTNLTSLNIFGNSVSDISVVSSLTNLARLNLWANSVSDISAVSGLTNLTELSLGNSVSDISALAGLTNLILLQLSYNSIADLSPLEANIGLGDGDEVDVRGNPLSHLSMNTHIPALQNRGVTVRFDNRAHPALLKISGDNQKGMSGAVLSDPFVVEVQDANGSALTGISVTFVVTAGGGTLSTTITRTDENGRAQSTLILGPNLEANTVEVSAAGIESRVNFHAISDTESPPTTADVNNDGNVNILDLTLIASRLGQSGQNNADINGDGVVNILDLVLVAGMFDDAAAAPSAQPQVSETLTAVEVQGWLTDARTLEVRDPIIKRGVVVLEQLLVSLTPIETELLANYPNPFNPETWIPYRLAEDAFVTLTIYDLSGHVVRTLDVGHRIASAYENRSKAIYWNGRNEVGEQVASGVYFYTLTAGDYSATRRMVILK
jgi:Leucine-rich repeat (LRR) protein